MKRKGTGLSGSNIYLDRYGDTVYYNIFDKNGYIVSKKIEKSTDKPSLYTVTYEYSYDKNLVQYDVSFDKPNGSTKIRKLNVAVFGESTN